MASGHFHYAVTSSKSTCWIQGDGVFRVGGSQRNTSTNGAPINWLHARGFTSVWFKGASAVGRIATAVLFGSTR